MLRTITRLYRAYLLWSGRCGDFTLLKTTEIDVPWVAVVLQRSTYCLTHSGIAYRTRQGGPLMMLHLGAHLRLYSDPIGTNLIFSVPEMKEEDQEFIAGFCRIIKRSDGRGSIPYSFEYDPDVMFDRDTGRLTTSDIGQGFTCSTFVAAVFRSSGNPLIDLHSWPGSANDEDVTARKEVLRLWRESGRADLIARSAEIEPSIRARRVRPEQVAGACLQPKRHRPALYKRCHADGIQVLAQWDSIHPRPSPD